MKLFEHCVSKDVNFSVYFLNDINHNSNNHFMAIFQDNLGELVSEMIKHLNQPYQLCPVSLFE